MRIKHSKYKNTGILFELLVRQITSDTLSDKPSPAKDLLHKYFVKSELGKEYKLYECLLNNTTLTEGKASMIVSTLLESSNNLNRGAVKRQKYNLINELRNHYDINEFFNHRLPNYKVHAAFYTLMELNSMENPTPKQLIRNKVTILEHLTSSKVKPNDIKDEVLAEISSSDKDIKLLTYKILLEKFNNKYDGLHPRQKQILREYINSVDNTSKLKDFHITQTNSLRQELKELNKSTLNEATKIKIDGVISLIKPPPKNSKVKDGDLVDLLQYCDLVNELKKVNG